MKKLLAFALILAGLLAAAVYAGPGILSEPARRLLVWKLNRETQPVFKDTVKIEKLILTRDLSVRMENLSARLQTKTGSAPLEIGTLNSRGPVPQLFSKDGLLFDFTGVRTAGSDAAGLHGVWQIVLGPEGFSDISADIDGLNFGDIVWMSPENLAGMTGLITGNLHLRSAVSGQVLIDSTLKVLPPGGEIQARFFQVLQPYLPGAAQPLLIQATLSGAVVTYKEAEAHITLAKPDELNVFLYLLVPVYNLNIRLNLTVKLDEENAFGKLAQVMGLLHPAATQ